MFAQSSVCTFCRFNTGSINSAPISRSRENFCRIKNCIYRNREFFIFPQDAKKRNMTAFGVPKGGAKISTEQDSFFADLQYFAYQENMDGFLHSQEH